MVRAIRSEVVLGLPRSLSHTPICELLGCLGRNKLARLALLTLLSSFYSLVCETATPKDQTCARTGRGAGRLWQLARWNTGSLPDRVRAMERIAELRLQMATEAPRPAQISRMHGFRACDMQAAMVRHAGAIPGVARKSSLVLRLSPPFAPEPLNSKSIFSLWTRSEQPEEDLRVAIANIDYPPHEPPLPALAAPH